MRRHGLTRGRALMALASAAAITTGAAFALDARDASAQTQIVQQQVSGNWSGYVVRSSAGKSFSSVSGSWVEPSVSASSGEGFAAFWVGLGGAGEQSQSLEQVGTSAQVVNGQTTYSAWYELVPAGQQTLNLTIHPGDHMSGKVTVNGTSVTISLTNSTTGASVTRTLQMSNPDTSSAEWIAEAPAAQYPDGGMQVLPLANFGKLTFTEASATAAGHTGSISDPAWTVEQVAMSSGAASQFVEDGGSPQSTGASAGGLSNSGSSFAVSYSSSAGSTGSDPAGYGGYLGGYADPGGYGYPGYGYADPGSYGYPGYGYAGYGWTVSP